MRMRMRSVAWVTFLCVLCVALAPGTISAEETCSEEDRKAAGKLRSKGDDAVMKKNYKEAVVLYSEAVALEPNNEKNFLKLFKAHEKMGHYKAALQDLDKAILLNEKSLSAFAFRGRTLLNLGKCEEAVKDFVHVLQLKPSHGDAKKLLPKAEKCAKEIIQAESFFQQGKFDLAAQKATEAMEITGKAPYVKLLRAKARFHMGDFFECIADCGDILKKDQDDQEALLLRGMAYYKVADHEMALRHFREGLHKDPEHQETKAWFRKLQKLIKLTKKGDELLNVHSHDSWQQALDVFSEALQVDPSHSEHRKTLFTKICRIHAKTKDKDKAKQACESAIQLDPSLLDPYIIYADLLTRTAEETADFEEALRAWQRAHDVDKENPTVREGLHKTEVGLRQSKQKNYYKILGVPRDADASQIKKAYRKLAKDYHPDRHGDKSDEVKQQMETKFQLVAEAYEVLSSDELRAKYDRGEEVFENQGNSGHHRHRGHPFGGRGRQYGFHF